MKKISILGSTGSIGTNALDIIRENKDKFDVVALSANNNYKKLDNQIKEFNPKYVAIGTEEGYEYLKNRYTNIEIMVGKKGLKQIGQLDETDTILTAVSGSVGLEATIEAIKLNKRIALANKETLVAGGYLIKNLLTKYNSEIIPVDSEHSAIFQSLNSGKLDEVERIILTASGGPFRNKDINFLENVTVEQALKHPNWDMGSKITIDSSTMVNKGLEVIEAHHLFNMSYDKIDVIVHPQSIIHSMVEFQDKSIIAQMGKPDMKVAIQYGLTYPERIKNHLIEEFDFLKFNNLTFEKPDLDTFRGLKLAYEAGKVGGTMPVVYNASNEVAVELFLNKKIKYLDIYKIIEESMENHSVEKALELDVINKVDLETREIIYSSYL